MPANCGPPSAEPARAIADPVAPAEASVSSARTTISDQHENVKSEIGMPHCCAVSYAHDFHPSEYLAGPPRIFGIGQADFSSLASKVTTTCRLPSPVASTSKDVGPPNLDHARRRSSPRRGKKGGCRGCDNRPVSGLPMLGVRYPRPPRSNERSRNPSISSWNGSPIGTTNRWASMSMFLRGRGPSPSISILARILNT